MNDFVISLLLKLNAEANVQQCYAILCKISTYPSQAQASKISSCLKYLSPKQINLILMIYFVTQICSQVTSLESWVRCLSKSHLDKGPTLFYS